MVTVPYEELAHTGDLQYRVTAESREELFSESARALFATIVAPDQVENREERSVHIEGATLEETLVNFLRSCLDLFNVDAFVGKSATVDIGGAKPLSVTATLRGERFNPDRHPFGTEIKAVTYHGASVEQKDNGWEAVFTLDL